MFYQLVAKPREKSFVGRVVGGRIFMNFRSTG